jgi:negative regulator of sigma E activity
MSDNNEKISVLMDDYRHTEEDQSVLNELQGDINQQYTLQRYQLISDVLSNEVPEHIRMDFAAEVRSRLEIEPAHNIKITQSDRSTQQPSWLWSMLFKPVAGLAVAAAVAIVTISSLQSPSTQQDQSVAAADSSQARVEQLASIPLISNAVRVAGKPENLTRQNGMNWNIKRNGPGMQSKLNTFLVNHNEYSSSIQGIIPQVRVVGFDAQR